MKKIYKYTGTGNNGTIAWALQRISAIVLFFVLGYHLYGKISNKAGLAESDGSNGILVSTLLVFLLFHGFNGLKMVTDDYVSRKGTRFVLYFIYWALALLLLWMGMSLLFSTAW